MPRISENISRLGKIMRDEGLWPVLTTLFAGTAVVMHIADKPFNERLQPVFWAIVALGAACVAATAIDVAVAVKTKDRAKLCYYLFFFIMPFAVALTTLAIW